MYQICEVALRCSLPDATAFGHTAARTAADHWHSSGADRNVVRASATRRPSACAVHGQGKAAARRTSTLTGATPDAARWRAGDPGARVRLHSDVFGLFKLPPSVTENA
jgi:hypothetical protein